MGTTRHIDCAATTFRRPHVVCGVLGSSSLQVLRRRGDCQRRQDWLCT
jgi:hypothetical protein